MIHSFLLVNTCTWVLGLILSSLNTVISVNKYAVSPFSLNIFYESCMLYSKLGFIADSGMHC